MYRQLDKVRLLEVLLEEERQIQFEKFDYADAWAVGSRLVELARERGFGVTITIAFGDQRVFHAALPGTSPENDDWLDRKFNVVRYYRMSSLAVRYRFESVGGDFAETTHDKARYAAAGGGFPLWVNGSLIGAVGVSGLEMHDDHALIVEVLSAHAGR
ncbi:heme-degrading domain-containing protein [Microbacteriaceae bacterium VKM Ac-2854]|nr:heme-degrading domain-containing protein [Microbacteriaceae bacterium VKM Ac-2854]